MESIDSNESDEDTGIMINKAKASNTNFLMPQDLVNISDKESTNSRVSD